EQSLGVAIALGVRKVADNILLDFVGDIEAKWSWVTNIEFENPVSFIFQSLGFTHDGTANLIADILQLVGFLYFKHSVEPTHGLKRLIIRGCPIGARRENRNFPSGTVKQRPE